MSASRDWFEECRELPSNGSVSLSECVGVCICIPQITKLSRKQQRRLSATDPIVTVQHRHAQITHISIFAADYDASAELTETRAMGNQPQKPAVVFRSEVRLLVLAPGQQEGGCSFYLGTVDGVRSLTPRFLAEFWTLAPWKTSTIHGVSRRFERAQL